MKWNKGKNYRPRPSDMYFHGRLLKDLVVAKDAKVILELGVRSVKDDRRATSTYIFYRALEKLDVNHANAPLRALYSCDMEVPSGDKKLLTRLKYSENPVWRFFHGDDREQLLPIEEHLNRENQKVDILLIDTDKNYELTKFELENYSKLLSESGIILMHDIGINWKWNDTTSSKYARKGYCPVSIEEFKGHDKATKEFMKSEGFKTKIQLGSYNIGILYRDISHLSGVEPNDLPYDNKRNAMSKWQWDKRRNDWNKEWGEYTDEENK
tara:strand:+ start:300 stop:1103 length:804 start_codon:yes stop_codon:yes gene_type:complete